MHALKSKYGLSIFITIYPLKKLIYLSFLVPLGNIWYASFLNIYITQFNNRYVWYLVKTCLKQFCNFQKKVGFREYICCSHINKKNSIGYLIVIGLWINYPFAALALVSAVVFLWKVSQYAHLIHYLLQTDYLPPCWVIKEQKEIPAIIPLDLSYYKYKSITVL